MYLIRGVCQTRHSAFKSGRHAALSLVCMTVLGLAPTCLTVCAQVLPDVGQTSTMDYAADRDRNLLDDAAIISLRGDLKSKDDSVRQGALRRLDDLGADAWPFVPELITIIDGVSDDDKQMALGIVATIGPKAALAVPILIDTLQDKQYLRDRAIAALGAIGPDAKEAVPALVKVLQGGAVTSNAEEALAKIGPDAIPQLLLGLSDKNPDCRRLCITALRDLKDRPDSVIAPIIKMLNDREFDVQREALWALEKIGKPASCAVPDLISMLKNKDQYLRKFAADALGAIGGPAKDALPLLNQSLENEVVRASARSAIKKIEHASLQ